MIDPVEYCDRESPSGICCTGISQLTSSMMKVLTKRGVQVFWEIVTGDRGLERPVV